VHPVRSNSDAIARALSRNVTPEDEVGAECF
jgi:hypothetical protein